MYDDISSRIRHLLPHQNGPDGSLRSLWYDSQYFFIEDNISALCAEKNDNVIFSVLESLNVSPKIIGFT